MPDRTNDQWLSDLRTPGPRQEAALGDLRASILKALPYALSVWLSPSDPQFQSLSEEVAQETLLRVLEKADPFEGRSQFTTWVHKIAVRIALSELRRRRWKDISLEAIVEEAESSSGLGLMADSAVGPDLAAEQADMLKRVARVIQEELTEKQRTVLIASRVRGMSATEIARRMGMKRNALYKLMHDARLKLKKRLADEGLKPEEVLAAFEGE